MVFSEFRRRFDVLAPHLTKKHGRNYIVVDERRVGLCPHGPTRPSTPCSDPSEPAALPCLERAGLALAQVAGLGCLGPGWALSSGLGGGGKAAWAMDCRNHRRATCSQGPR